MERYTNGMLVEVSSAFAHRFDGTFPEIPTYEHVDVAMLTEGDESPIYINLDILEVNRVSRNGLLYDEEFVSALVSQMSTFGENGMNGHPSFLGGRDGELADDIYWVGHLRQGDTVWGKGYVPPGRTRELIRRRKANHGRIGTSVIIQGEFEWVDEERSIFRIRKPELLQIDLVHANAASLQKNSDFKITSETARGEHNRKPENEGDQMTLTRESVLADLKANEVPTAIREAIINEAKVQADAATVTDLRQQLTEANTKLTAVEAAKTALESQVAEMTTKIADMQRIQFEAALNAAIAEKTSKWNVASENGKAAVASLHANLLIFTLSKLGETRDATAITEAVEAAWTENAVLVNAIKVNLAGPAAAIPPRQTERQNTGENNAHRYVSKEGAAELSEKFGLPLKGAK